LLDDMINVIFVCVTSSGVYLPILRAVIVVCVVRGNVIRIIVCNHKHTHVSNSHMN